MSPEEALKPLKLFAFYCAEHPAPQSSSIGRTVLPEPLRGLCPRETEAGGRQQKCRSSFRDLGTHPSPVTAAECAVPMSAHTIGSWFKGADWAHMNTVASSTWSSGEGSSTELIRSRPSLLHLHGEKHSSELAECTLAQTPRRQILL